MRGADLTAVIAWLEAGCDPAEAAKELRSYQEALSSQSLSLSEAREEIERSEIGRHRLGHALRGAESKAADADWWKSRALRSERERDEALEALRRIADGPWPDGVETPVDQCKFDEQIARSVLENSKAGLADDPSNAPLSDVSSLRKGAEVAVKPLVWTSASPPSWYAVCPVSRKGYIIDREEGKWWACWNVDLPGFDDLDEAKAAAQSDFETRIRSALVSGSREDGADG